MVTPKTIFPTQSTFRRPKNAFTLVEVMAAMFVITVAIFPTLVLCLGSYRISQQAQAQTAAYLLAQKQIETLRALPWASRPTSGTVSFTVPAATNDQVLAVGTANTSVGLQAQYTVSTVSATVQQVTVRVWWLDAAARGRTSEICLDTLFVK